MEFLHCLEQFLFKILILLLSLVFTPLCLLSPLLFLPLLLWRTFIGYLGLILNSQNLELMSARNSVVAIDDLHTNPEQSIVVIIGLTAPLSFDLFFERMELIILKDYPEFKRFYESWCGYLFWREDLNFNLKNHCKVYHKNVDKDWIVTHDELKDYCLNLVKAPFPRGKSPWEFILVNNFQMNDKLCAVILCHVHHGLCDGFSILQFFTSVVDQWETTKEKLPVAVWAKGAVQPTFWQYALMILLTPYNLIKQGASLDINHYRISKKRLKKKLVSSQIQIDINKVKEIKLKWNVTFSTIVFSAIIGGFRNFMLAKGLNVPHNFHVGAPFPWPYRKSMGLQNSMCVCILTFPVGKETIAERVKSCEKNWINVKNSTVPLMNWTLMPLMGLFPRFVVKLLVQNNVTTMVLSNFPGPQESLQLSPEIATGDVEFVVGLFRGNCGIGIGLISCNGVLKINVGVDEALLSSKEEVEEIKQFIQNEFNILATYHDP